MTWFPCDLLGADVELTNERERHIRRRHSNVSPADLAWVLAEPDFMVRRPWRPEETLFTREVDDLGGVGHIVVAVVTDEPDGNADAPRHWIATSYRSDALPTGVVIWQRS